MTWRSPDTYHPAGIERGTATSTSTTTGTTSLAIIDHGRVVVEGPPSRVKDTFARVQITELTTSRSDRTLVEQLEALAGVARVSATVDGPYRRIAIHTDPRHALGDLLRSVLSDDEHASLRIRPPTLEEAYLSIVTNERNASTSQS